MPVYHSRRFLSAVQAPLVVVCLPGLTGCFDWSSLSKPTGAEGKAAENIDAFAAAAAELSPGEQAYLDAARPFIEAMVQRDYAAAYARLSPMAKQRFSRNQFVPADDERESARYEAEAVVNPTVEQFVALMQAVETTYGIPRRFDPPTVETDPEVLSRKDALLAALEIGAMPDTIPVEQRKAAVQAWVYFTMSDDQIRQAAQQEGMDEGEYRELLSGSESGGEGPYFKLKTVVIDAGAGPVVGYFEIAPPSILD